MKTFEHAIAFILCVHLCLIDRQTHAQQDTVSTQSQVRAAWEKRRETYSSVKIQLEIKEITPKGAYSKQLPPPLSSGDAQPPKEAAHVGKCTLILNGTKARISRETMAWHVSQRKFNQRLTDTIIDRNQFKTLVKHGGQDWPTGRISKEGWGTESDMIIWPLLLALRGDDKNVVGAAGLDGFESARVKTLAPGLIEMVRSRDEQRGERKLWVDPSRSFSPIRHDMFARTGELQSRFAIGETRVVKNDWIPTKWSVDEFVGSSLLRHAEVAVVLLEVDVVSDRDLELDFPVGTYVTDATTDKREQYIVKESTKRIVLPEERAAGYQTLTSTETGELLPQSKGSSSRWAWVLSGVGLFAVLLALLWSYSSWKSRRKPSTNSSPDPLQSGDIS